MDFDVGVIIAAAGLGTRLGGSEPKQYCKIMVIIKLKQPTYLLIENQDLVSASVISLVLNKIANLFTILFTSNTEEFYHT